MENISCFSMAARALRIGSYGFINKAQFYAGFTDRLKLRDGAVTAIKDPGHESEPQVDSVRTHYNVRNCEYMLHGDKTGASFSMSKRHGSCPEENLDITGGSFVLSNGFSDKSFLRYICPDGYYPSVQSRRCQYGLWTPKTSTQKTPECKKVTCPNPRVLENGQVTPYKERYYVNDTTTYSCHSDYKFRGSAVRVCKPNGKWSGSTPICGHDSDHCPDPGVPPGSSRTGHMFHIGDKVTYRCDSSLTLIGSKERVCQHGGQWSGTEPQCYADFTYDTPEEASEAFSSALKSNLAVSQQYGAEDQHGKKITLDQGGKLDIYIAVDASDSIDEEDFNKAKNIIKMLIEQCRMGEPYRPKDEGRHDSGTTDRRGPLSFRQDRLPATGEWVLLVDGWVKRIVMASQKSSNIIRWETNARGIRRGDTNARGIGRVSLAGQGKISTDWEALAVSGGRPMLRETNAYGIGCVSLAGRRKKDVDAQ
ncbi:Complement factor B [Anabarilius grahami]|uniref:Complement factor B n=1 Tax=Anabarilius grahami TaxID=495550 RepID=A0A3N0YVF4_ANAGA|nr:Complement factor B [Anabarilius grahami]